jgi:uncharacterized protein (TIGR02679 family)
MLLERPAYKPLWGAARRRLESNGVSLEGTPLKLKGLTPDEADAIAGLLGVPRPGDGSVRVTLTHLDDCLRSSVVGQGLVEVLSALGGPVEDRRARRERTRSARARTWQEISAHRALLVNTYLADWVEHLRSKGLARRVAGDKEGEAVCLALDTVATIEETAVQSDAGLRLPVLAARVTGDAHGLDRGRPVGTLAVHALAWLAGQPFPQDASDWRRVWAEAGVACDDLSCDALVLNLPGWAAEPLRLTLRQVSSWPAQPPRYGTVCVTENPAVVAAATDHLGARAPTMVCLDGMPSTATLLTLSGLVAAGGTVHYHGDFDWRGLAIAEVLVRKVPTAQPWRFSARDYAGAVQRGFGTVALSGLPHPSPWDPDLALVMRETGKAIYEEQVLEDLLEDMSKIASVANRTQ